MEKRPDERSLILRAVDLVIADVEQRDDSQDREEGLRLLNRLRESLLDDNSTAG